MADFPAISSGFTAIYPVVESIRYPTGKVDHLNGSAQFWRKGAGLRRFVLEFRRINRADKNTIVTFLDSIKGSYDATWTMPIGGVDYDFCVLEADTIQITESTPEYFSISLALHQVRKN